MKIYNTYRSDPVWMDIYFHQDRICFNVFRVVSDRGRLYRKNDYHIIGQDDPNELTRFIEHMQSPYYQSQQVDDSISCNTANCLFEFKNCYVNSSDILNDDSDVELMFIFKGVIKKDTVTRLDYSCHCVALQNSFNPRGTFNINAEILNSECSMFEYSNSHYLTTLATLYTPSKCAGFYSDSNLLFIYNTSKMLPRFTNLTDNEISIENINLHRSVERKSVVSDIVHSIVPFIEIEGPTTISSDSKNNRYKVNMYTIDAATKQKVPFRYEMELFIQSSAGYLPINTIVYNGDASSFVLNANDVPSQTTITINIGPKLKPKLGSISINVY